MLKKLKQNKNLYKNLDPSLFFWLLVQSAPQPIDVPSDTSDFFNTFSHITFSCSKSTIETLEKVCEICSKLTIKTLKRRQ